MSNSPTFLGSDGPVPTGLRPPAP